MGSPMATRQALGSAESTALAGLSCGQIAARLGFKAHGEREEAAAAGLWQIEIVNGDGLLKLD